MALSHAETQQRCRVLTVQNFNDSQRRIVAYLCVDAGLLHVTLLIWVKAKIQTKK